jgi:hypothetical protein
MKTFTDIEEKEIKSNIAKLNAIHKSGPKLSAMCYLIAANIDYNLGYNFDNGIAAELAFNYALALAKQNESDESPEPIDNYDFDKYY